MSKISEDIKALREALAKGPTPGPWEVAGGDGSIVTVGRIYGPNKNLPMQVVTPTFRAENREADSNREYIAACSPDRIQRVLDRVKELEQVRDGFVSEVAMRLKEIKRLREALEYARQHSNVGWPSSKTHGNLVRRLEGINEVATAALEKKDE